MIIVFLGQLLAQQRGGTFMATACLIALSQSTYYFFDSITILVEANLKCEYSNARSYYFLVLSNNLPENSGETILLKFLVLPVTGIAVSVVGSHSKRNFRDFTYCLYVAVHRSGR